MDIVLRQVHRHEAPADISYWFSMYDELWLVESASHPTYRTYSKEDALEYIIEYMTGINLEA